MCIFIIISSYYDKMVDESFTNQIIIHTNNLWKILPDIFMRSILHSKDRNEDVHECMRLPKHGAKPWVGMSMYIFSSVMCTRGSANKTPGSRAIVWADNGPRSGNSATIQLTPTPHGLGTHNGTWHFAVIDKVFAPTVKVPSELIAYELLTLNFQFAVAWSDFF